MIIGVDCLEPLSAENEALIRSQLKSRWEARGGGDYVESIKVQSLPDGRVVRSTEWASKEVA